MRRSAAVLVVLLAASSARAEPPARPLFDVDLGGEPEVVYADGAGVVVGRRGHFEQRDLATGALLATATVPGEGAIYAATSGRGFGVFSPEDAPRAHGWVGVSYGGLGGAPDDRVFSLDLAHLAVRWTIDDSGRPARATAERDGVVLLEESRHDGSDRAIAAVSATDGHVLWRTPMPDLPSTGVELLWDSGTVWLVAFGGDVGALDARTGRVRFRAHFGASGDATPIRQGRAVAGRLVLAGDRDVWCIDASGVELWRAPLASAWLESLDGDGVVVQPHMAPLVVLDVATGAPRATIAVAQPHELRRVGDYVVDLAEAEAIVLDARSGALLQRFTVPAIEELVASGSVLFGVADGHVVSLDVATGAQWRAARPVSVGSPLAVAGDVVAACSDGGVVHGFATADGAPLWRVSLGRLGAGTDVRACRLYDGGASAVLAVGAGHVVHVLAAHPGRPSVPITTVHVQLAGPARVSGIRVAVDDARGTTDATGAVAIRVRAAGTMSVVVDERTLPRCMAADTAQVPVGRARDVHVSLRYGADYCRCHDCD